MTDKQQKWIALVVLGVIALGLWAMIRTYT